MPYTVNFYRFNKRRNSTKRPSTVTATYSCELKSPCSIEQPVIELPGNISTPDFNYAYIPAFSRYYYCPTKTYDSGLWVMSLECDLLASAKSDIQAATAHVLYSSSSYDLDILDPRVVSKAELTIAAASYAMTGALTFSTLNQGSYMLTVMNDATDITTCGATTTYIMSLAELTAFARLLNSQNVLDQLKLMWNDPFSGIIECYYIPFNYDPYLFAGSVNAIKVGNLTFGGVSAHYPYNGMMSLNTANATITIPWAYSDYRNQQPFTTFELFVPYCGAKTLDQNLFIGKSTLTLDYSVDFISGNIQAILHSDEAIVETFEGNCKIQLPLAQAQSRIKDIASLAGGLGATVGGLIAGSGAVAAGGALAAFNSITTGGKYNSTGGFNGSILGMSLGADGAVGDWQHIQLVRRTYVASDTPDNMRATMGNPLNTVTSLSTLTGYLQTQGASVAGIWTDAELARINAALDSGIYIE